MAGGSINVAIAPGELIDKITILAIKLERIIEADKLQNIRREMDILARTRAEALPASAELDRLTEKLKAVNEKLWQIEDDIRECEAAGDFGPRFVELARAIYINNDARAEAKREINLLLGSDIIEEKSYKPY
ncbi:MAG: DUF6165 family protein [Rhodospirillales bacterium]|nr:DUF6165 family protein [Rhodospirillales bacterium]MDP6644524.1 DUF6165 family protein [Rhodospirillales bacterium]MDP6843163.1 DUF6165 family protein [Rhodospirillales bacterium]